MTFEMRFVSISISFAVFLALQGCSGNDGDDAATGADAGPGAQTAPSAAAPSGSGPDIATATPASEAETQATADAGVGVDADAGAQVYKTYCVTCHGLTGAGDGPASAGLNPKPASFATSSFRLDANGNKTPGELEDIKAVVHDGAAKHGGSPLMAPWPMLSPEQLDAVARHVKSLSGGT